MRAILRDKKGWSKTMTLPYAMHEIRIPLHRKRINVFEHNEGSFIARDNGVDLVIFRLTGRGLDKDTFYYDEYDGASGNVSSSFNESQAGATPAPISKLSPPERKKT